MQRSRYKNFQKREEGVMQLEPGNVARFMAAISSDIDQALARSGADIVGRGRGGNQGLEGIDLTDIQTFSVRYSAGQTDGVINVWGVHGDGTSFGLIAVITEWKRH